jgi:hypothetical protein
MTSVFFFSCHIDIVRGICEYDGIPGGASESEGGFFAFAFAGVVLLLKTAVNSSSGSRGLHFGRRESKIAVRRGDEAPRGYCAPRGRGEVALQIFDDVVLTRSSSKVAWDLWELPRLTLVSVLAKFTGRRRLTATRPCTASRRSAAQSSRP